MEITLNGTTIELTESTLNEASVNQLLNFWIKNEAQLYFAETDELCIICLQNSQPTEKGKYCLNDYDRGRLLFARQYLLSHVMIPPSIEELAQIAGINQFKLKNGFRELFGTTIYGYLNRFRIESAAHLIAQGEKNMTQIAFELGFSSLQHFSAAFKKARGCSPKKIKTTPSIS